MQCSLPGKASIIMSCALQGIRIYMKFIHTYSKIHLLVVDNMHKYSAFHFHMYMKFSEMPRDRVFTSVALRSLYQKT